MQKLLSSSSWCLPLFWHIGMVSVMDWEVSELHTLASVWRFHHTDMVNDHSLQLLSPFWRMEVGWKRLEVIQLTSHSLFMSPLRIIYHDASVISKT